MPELTAADAFARLMQVSNRENNLFEHLQIENRDVLLLKGERGLQKLADLLDRFDQGEFQERLPQMPSS